MWQLDLSILERGFHSDVEGMNLASSLLQLLTSAGNYSGSRSAGRLGHGSADTKSESTL